MVALPPGAAQRSRVALRVASRRRARRAATLCSAARSAPRRAPARRRGQRPRRRGSRDPATVDRVDERAPPRGRIWPQSRASQLVGLAVGSRPGKTALDLCAAPGGKATMLAGEIDAVEVDESRAEAFRKTAERLDARGVRVIHADGRRLPSELTGYDRALVDAPCSGLGVLASRPDLRWRAKPLPLLQLELLRAAVDRPRSGGTVVYSTCTINRAESEDVVDAVVADGAARIDDVAWRRVAAVPTPRAAGAPPDAAAPPRDEPLLRRAPQGACRHGLTSLHSVERWSCGGDAEDAFRVDVAGDRAAGIRASGLLLGGQAWFLGAGGWRLQQQSRRLQGSAAP